MKILPPSFPAVAIADITTYIAFVEAEGELADHSSENEMIVPGFYTREEVAVMLEQEAFGSRAQLAAYFYTQ